MLATFVVAASPCAASDVLTNDGVIKMVKAGLCESVVIQKIRTSEKKFEPGKQDRNLPINKNQGFWIGYTGATFQHGVDPKYGITLTSEPGPNGGVQLKLTEPLKPGEYGFIAVTRGQPNLVEVFDFAVE